MFYLKEWKHEKERSKERGERENHLTSGSFTKLPQWPERHLTKAKSRELYPVFPSCGRVPSSWTISICSPRYMSQRWKGNTAAKLQIAATILEAGLEGTSLMHCTIALHFQCWGPENSPKFHNWFSMIILS